MKGQARIRGHYFNALAGIVLGGFIGMLAEGVPALSWLGYDNLLDLKIPLY